MEIISDRKKNISNAEYLFIEGEEPTNDYEEVILAKDVKQFIKELKDNVDRLQKDCATLEICDKEDVLKLIDKLAGDKLR